MALSVREMSSHVSRKPGRPAGTTKPGALTAKIPPIRVREDCWNWLKMMGDREGLTAAAYIRRRLYELMRKEM